MKITASKLSDILSGTFVISIALLFLAYPFTRSWKPNPIVICILIALAAIPLLITYLKYLKWSGWQIASIFIILAWIAGFIITHK